MLFMFVLDAFYSDVYLKTVLFLFEFLNAFVAKNNARLIHFEVKTSILRQHRCYYLI